MAYMAYAVLLARWRNGLNAPPEYPHKLWGTNQAPLLKSNTAAARSTYCVAGT